MGHDAFSVPDSRFTCGRGVASIHASSLCFAFPKHVFDLVVINFCKTPSLRCVFIDEGIALLLIYEGPRMVGAGGYSELYGMRGFVDF